MKTLHSFVFNNFAENTYIITHSAECAIIDPGCYGKEELDRLTGIIESEKIQPAFIINTHAHIDHVLGVTALKNYYNIPFFLSRDEVQILQSNKVLASTYGFPDWEEPSVDGFLDDKTNLKIGGMTWQILSIPGHSPGHLAFYNRSENIVISGDALFKGSIGRTDLPGGNFNILINSIRTKIFTLPDDTLVYPGHGPETTVGAEKKYNPFFGKNI